MAGGFGGSVKLIGESEYKKALSDISGNLKVLSSEMKVVTSQYSKNDTSVNNLTSQNEVLNKKIEEQSKKVITLKEALLQAKNETGESSNTTKKWQTELNNAQAELNSLNKKLEDNKSTINEVENVTDNESKSLKNMSNAAEETSQKTLKLGDIIKANLISDVIKSGVKAVAESFKSVKSAMGEALTSGASYADNMLTLSTQTGVSTESLQKYSAVAELVDVSTETMTSSMAKNIKSMSSGKDAYKDLGIAVTDANGNLRDSDTVYWESIDALGKVEDSTKRDALAMEIFGKSAQDLNPLIVQGSEGIRTLREEAVNMGAVLSEDGLKSLGALDDEIQKSKTITTGLTNIFASAFAPACTEMMSGVNGVASSFNGLIASILGGGAGDIDDHLEQLSQSIKNMITNISGNIPQIMQTVQSLITVITQAISENLPLIIQGGIQIFTSLLSGITTSLVEILPAITQALMAIVQAVIENLPIILDAGIQILMALVQGIATSLPTLIPAIIDAVLTMATTLLDNIDLIIDAGIQLIIGLAEGLINALPQLIDKIPEIIDKMIVAITNNLPKIIQAGIQLTIMLAGGLIKAIPQLLSKIPQIIGSLVSGFANYFSNMGEVGKNLVRGIWEGIKNAKDWLIGKVKEWCGNIVDGIKSFFGIHSPSTLFRDEVGNNLAYGLGEGFSNAMSDVTKDMQNSIPTEFDINSSLSKNSDSMNLNNLRDAFLYAVKNLDAQIIIDKDVAGKFVIQSVNNKFGEVYS